MDTFPIDFSWSEKDTTIFLPILAAIICFIIYWFTAHSAKIKANFYQKHTEDVASAKHILFTKYFGFITMGVVPLILCITLLPGSSLSSYGVYFETKTTLLSTLWILGLGVVVVPLVYFSAKQPKNLKNYPQIRAKVWDRNLRIKNASGWFFYLLGYEVLFRGVLLFPLYHEIGLWPAIAVNIALYSATHVPKGLDETIGAIPLSVVLCILTIQTNTIWIAFVVHVLMAWTNSFTALKYNPEMKSK